MLFSMELFFSQTGYHPVPQGKWFLKIWNVFCILNVKKFSIEFHTNVPIITGLYGSEAYNRISILAHHSSHPWNVVCHLCLVLHNICFSSWAVGGSFPNYMLNKDKFAPRQNFEASGATSTAENTKGKKQNFACFDLIRCVLSLSSKKGNSRKIWSVAEFFLHFSAFILFDALLGCIWTKKSHLNTRPPFYNLIQKFYLSHVSPQGLWGFPRNYLKKGLITVSRPLHEQN